MSLSRFVSTRAVAALLTVTATSAIVGVALVGNPTPVQAYKQYADKEGVSCAYCHANPQGGGKRNYRGKFYKKNGLTFAGFDDAAEAMAAGEPIAPDADAKPKSLVPPAAPMPSPSPVATPEPVATPTPAKPDPSAAARAKVAAMATKVKATPKNATLRKQYAAALAGLSTSLIANKEMEQEDRWSQALKYSREALTYDKTNKQAKTNIQTITKAYKSIGKPLPK